MMVIHASVVVTGRGREVQGGGVLEACVGVCGELK